jgi:L-glutamine-phosphate cytidylyltransferase
LKAIILSAGRGSRLLPMTESKPKCLLEFCGRTVLRHQLEMLNRAGVAQATVVTGFMPALVEAEVAAWRGQMRAETLFNPFFQIADNLASCWMARAEMMAPFLLVNGDTLFDRALIDCVMQAERHPVTVTVDRKDSYDDDDMKVSLDGERLRAIGKRLPLADTDAESIGMLKFSEDGAARFREKLEQMMRTQDGISAWFLKAIDMMARSGGDVGTCSIEGNLWCELDTREDFEHLQSIGPALIEGSQR